MYLLTPCMKFRCCYANCKLFMYSYVSIESLAKLSLEGQTNLLVCAIIKVLYPVLEITVGHFLNNFSICLTKIYFDRPNF